MRHLWLLTICGLVLTATVSMANPFVCDDTANTCTYRATVTEPTKKVGGATLDNLKQTNLKAQVNNGNFTTTVKLATAPTGGGTVVQDYTFATVNCQVTTFSVKASATNTLNAEGPDSALVTVKRDRTVDPTCAPEAPAVTLN